MSGAITRGVLFVHSAPRALCPHVEWAAGAVLGSRVSFDWTVQPAARGLHLFADVFAYFVQMYVSGHKLGVGVHHGDDGLAEVLFLDSRRAPQRARAGHVPTFKTLF